MWTNLAIVNGGPTLYSIYTWDNPRNGGFLTRIHQTLNTYDSWDDYQVSWRISNRMIAMVVDISVDLPYRSLNYIRLLHIIYIYIYIHTYIYIYMSIIIAITQLLIRNHGYIMVYHGISNLSKRSVGRSHKWFRGWLGCNMAMGHLNPWILIPLFICSVRYCKL